MIIFTKHLYSSNFRVSFIHPTHRMFSPFFVFLFKQEVHQQAHSLLNASLFLLPIFTHLKKHNNDAELDIQWNINHADVSSRGLTSAQEAQAVKAN